MSILKIKQFLTAVSIFGSMALASVAQAKEITVVVYAAEGGNSFRQSQMLVDSLTKTGYQVNFVKANNCINTKNFFKNNPQTPAIFLFADLIQNEFSATGCDLSLTKDNFVTTAYFRINAMCSAAKVHANAESALALIRSNKPITVASSTGTPSSVIESMGTALGKKVTMVPYSGTSGSVRGVLSKDADFWYGGLTAGIAENKELFCWANTGPATIQNMVPLKKLIPNYERAEFGSYWYVQSNGLNADTKKTIKQDLDAIFASDEWRQFMTKGHMIPGSDLPHIGVNEIIKNINLTK